MEPLVVHMAHVNGRERLTVKAWPRETTFRDDVLETANLQVLKRVGDLVTVTVDNGQAVYQLHGVPEPLTLTWIATLVSSRLTEEA